MVKILHIARPIAGIGVYVSLLSKYLDSSKFSNTIICNTNEDIIDIVNDNGVKIDHFHCELKREIRFIYDIKCLIGIFKIVKKLKPDIIHCHSSKSGILGRIIGFITNTKTLYTPNAYSYLSADAKSKRFLLKSIERFFGLLPVKTLACSTSELNRAIVDLSIKKDNVTLWNNSIENEIITKNSEYLSKLPKDFICSIGRPSYQKHTELLIKAVLKIKETQKNIHLVILGVGFYSPTLNKIKKSILSNNLSENITLVPWLERSEGLGILDKSLIFVSSSRYEGLPYAVLEALSLSKPCVLTNVDGNKDLVKNNYNGFLVDENADELAQKIDKILSDTVLRKDMEKNARKEFESFYDIKKNIKTLEKIYLSFIK
ncbi:Glycosyltransferase involved in cell wall bisynthesis [Polaribacter sp. KT25b]|uniref:glycosyltransferase n=1 Tax=Polaribacter sp. KT25b TaxID=1855336 RepID=UPI00087B2078|nr:glycosyltransferase [Polaribacter sp. KT25b]SDS38746.1 Glycosyltransferase involved in cell wall bisynthesis [Polaribacter sp. KT25b]